MMMWQPIETAPRDATAILVMRDIWPGTRSGRAEECNGHNTYVAAWWSDERGGQGAWICYMDAVLDPECPVEPTHWMPLPDPPGAQPASSIPVEAIGKMLADVMAVAVSNGANSVSMPDEYVEVAAWLQGIPVQPVPSVPEGWLRAIDEALVVAHIGTANADDTYEQAKFKLDSLIGFHVDVATNPAVNRGWKLVPIEPTEEMYNAGANHCDGYWSTAQAVWDAMLAAAPETKL